MGLFVPRKTAKHKRFDYTPRFHNPEKEKKLKERMRIKSKAGRRRSPMGIIYSMVLLMIVFYIYQNLMR